MPKPQPKPPFNAFDYVMTILFMGGMFLGFLLIPAFGLAVAGIWMLYLLVGTFIVYLLVAILGVYWKIVRRAREPSEPPSTPPPTINKEL